MLNLFASAIASIGMLFGGLFGHGPAQGSSTSPFNGDHGQHMGSTTPGMRSNLPSVFGVITGINGTTITISGMQAMPGMEGMHMGSGEGDSGKPSMHMASTTFTVDAGNAKVLGMGSTTSSIANLKDGENIAVVGAVNGTSVTAKIIITALRRGMGMMMHPGMGSSTPNHKGGWGQGEGPAQTSGGSN